MILSSFVYKEPGWEMRDLAPLKLVNLLVARNATGKTRTIKALGNVVSFLQMKTVGMASLSFDVVLTFASSSDSDWKMEYGFKVSNGYVERENLSVNGKIIIKRTKAVAKYDDFIINPPSDKLVAQIRRDKDQYPEIERLMVWAEGILTISCSDISPYSSINPLRYSNPFSFSEMVERLSDVEKKNLISLAGTLGYQLNGIKTIDASGVKLVQLRERSVSRDMVDMQLSGGMLRTLYLLCLVSIANLDKKVSLLLIDDMSEGLDYRRSIDLGKIIFDYCSNSGLQIIASSNDSFLMDVVDLSNWQVLRRVGSKVSALNQSSCPDLFRKFRLTGLSNFDFFSSDFIDSYFSK